MGNRDNKQAGYSCDDWEHHYKINDLGWDLGVVAPPFVRLWEDRMIVPCKAVVPGCGRGHEAIFLAERGYNVTAVDYTHGAVSHLKQALLQRNIFGEVLCQDFFEINASYNNSFDLLLENTFFCAIDPAMRHKYVLTAGRILKPGALFVGLFYETGKEGGPPFNTRRKDIEDFFSNQFVIEVLNKTPHSAEQRQGKEWLGIFKKK